MATIEPFAHLNYTDSHEKKYTENGADTLNLAVNADSASLLRTEMGTDFFKTFTWKEGRIIPKVRIGYVFKKPLKKSKHTVSLLGQNGDFSVTDFTKSLNQLTPAVGIVYQNDVSAETHSANLRAGILF